MEKFKNFMIIGLSVALAYCLGIMTTVGTVLTAAYKPRDKR